MRIRLVVVEGPDRGICFEFDGYNRIVVGRAGTHDMGGRRPRDLYMSRYHFLLEAAGAVCGVRDLGSRTGIRINGSPVEMGVLQEGDALRAGHTDFRVELDRSYTAVVSSGDEGGVGPLGPSLEDYADLEEEASGALGVVYRAREVATGRTVAVKMLKPEREMDDYAVGHFLREMDVWRTLHHKHVVRIYAVGRAAEDLWIAMEFVEGPNLQEHCEMYGPLTIADACRFGVHVLSALAYGHDQGIIHRDVKPENILLKGPKGEESALVADYGLAKNFLDTGGAALTSTGSMKGTPPFMAPEQLLNAKGASPLADLFSVGATLYWGLTGRSHLDAEDGSDARTVERWNRLLEGEFLPVRRWRPEIPAELADAIDRSLCRQPHERFATAHEMADELRRVWGRAASE